MGISQVNTSNHICTKIFWIGTPISLLKSPIQSFSEVSTDDLSVNTYGVVDSRINIYPL